MSGKREGIIEVGWKPIVRREAVATGVVNLSQESKQAITSGEVAKGDVIEASTVAAIQAVKETPRMIPHCHIIPIEGCSVEWVWVGESLQCTVTVSAHWKTGVEMEALAGVTAGLLCAWDMVKSIEKDQHGEYPETSITDVRVLSKTKSSAE